MEARRIRPAIHHFSTSGVKSSDVGLHTMAILFCRTGIPRGSRIHLACRPLILPPCRHSQRASSLLQTCLGLQVTPGHSKTSLHGMESWLSFFFPITTSQDLKPLLVELFVAFLRWKDGAVVLAHGPAAAMSGD